MSEQPQDYANDRRSTPYTNTKEHLHLSKSVSYGHILSTVMIMVTGLTYVNGIAGDVETVKKVQQIQNDNVVDEIKEWKNETRESLRDIKRSLEKLVDRELSKNGN